MPPSEKKNYAVMPLGEILLDLGYITGDQWEGALATAHEHTREFQDVLLTQSVIDLGQLTHAYALQNGLRFWDWGRVRQIIEKYRLRRMRPPADVPDLQHLAWARKGGPVLLAIADLSDASARAQLRAEYAKLSKKVEIVAVTSETLMKAARRSPMRDPAPPPPANEPQGDTDVLTHPPPLGTEPGDTLPPGAEDSNAEGTVVDGYVVEGRLAAGAAGTVYVARQTCDNTRVALKRMHPALAADELAVKQMLSERELLERFDHPNIIRVFGGGLWDGVPYFAMELMPGDSLADRLTTGEPLSIATVMRLWCQMAHALAYAHRMGILHRDVKPANVLLTDQLDAKVVDFGVAHAAGAEQGGAAAGTLLYMAPEQLRGQPLTPAVDLYGVGMVAFEMLTGKIPDAHLDLQAMLRRRQQREFTFDDVRRPLTRAMREGQRQREVGASLTDFARILHTCLRKNPKDRFPSAEALCKHLLRVMKLRRWKLPPLPPLPDARPHTWSSDEDSRTRTMATMQSATSGPANEDTAVASLITIPTEEPETQIPDDYEVIRLLGRGSMGEVFLARDRDTRRQVALKMIAPEMAANRRFRDRFQREAEVLGRLQHPSIVHIYGVQFEGTAPHIAMEYIQGQDLDDVLKQRKRLTVAESVPVIMQVADALEHVHSLGVIHRDLKPSNLMVTTEGRVKILDFGVAKDTEGAELTKSGAVIGTPHYMSPEQAAGKQATPLSDMYALGMIWYQLLVGRVPFRGSIAEVLHQHVAIQPPHVRDSVPVPDELNNMVARMLRKEARDRPQTFREIVVLGERLLAPPSSLTRAWHGFMSPLLLAGIGGGMLWYGFGMAREDLALEVTPPPWILGLMAVGALAATLGSLRFLWRLFRRS